MIELKSEPEMKEQQKWFPANAASLFPERILHTSVQTNPTSVVSISVYPNQRSANHAMAMRDKVFKDPSDTMSGWTLEGPEDIGQCQL